MEKFISRGTGPRKKGGKREPGENGKVAPKVSLKKGEGEKNSNRKISVERLSENSKRRGGRGIREPRNESS